MDNELYEIQEKIKEYVNKNNADEFRVYIMDLYDKKSVTIKIDK